ncbi:MAG: twin-arginine translocase TatA/TatE family subunit [Alphaproteobacteria bacterium]|nr:MAG: twin-arginine translocase TatA/TatE family subunit [Alphaproteobacteria bacterium]
MGGFSLWHWLIVLVVVLVLFGAGRLPQVAGDLAKGIRAFRKGLDEDPHAKHPPAALGEADKKPPEPPTPSGPEGRA